MIEKCGFSCFFRGFEAVKQVLNLFRLVSEVFLCPKPSKIVSEMLKNPRFETSESTH